MCPGDRIQLPNWFKFREKSKSTVIVLLYYCHKLLHLVHLEKVLKNKRSKPRNRALMRHKEALPDMNSTLTGAPSMMLETLEKECIYEKLLE
jgi:hypothetical protein